MFSPQEIAPFVSPTAIVACVDALKFTQSLKCACVATQVELAVLRIDLQIDQPPGAVGRPRVAISRPLILSSVPDPARAPRMIRLSSIDTVSMPAGKYRRRINQTAINEE